MPQTPITIGRITIVPEAGWRFFPVEEQIVGRRDSRVGGIDLWLKFLEHAPLVRTHRESLRLASQVLPSEGLSDAFHFERIRWGPCFCGGASFTAGQDFIRLWYVHQGNALLPAIYACKADQRKTPDAIREVIECGRMISSLSIQPPTL